MKCPALLSIGILLASVQVFLQELDSMLPHDDVQGQNKVKNRTAKLLHHHLNPDYFLS